MGFLAGMAGALGDRLYEHQLLGLQNAISAKKDLLENYKGLLADPTMQDVHGDIAQTMINAAGTDPQKLQKALKPGGDFDPTKWLAQAQRRRMGLEPNPTQQGQNPTQIGPPPTGQTQQGPAGQGMQLPSWNDAQKTAQAAQGMAQNGGTPPYLAANIPPPPGQGQGQQGQPPGGGAGGTGGGGAGVNPSSPASSSAPGAGQISAGSAQQVGNMQAQALQALPPVAGSPAPNGAEVASPMQASAVQGPPPDAQYGSAQYGPAQYGPVGNLLPEAAFQRDLQHQVATLKAAGATNLEINQHKLQAMEPYLQGIDPRVANMIRSEVVQGGSGSSGQSAVINTMFAAPQQRRYQRPDGTLGIEYVDRFGNVTSDNQGYAGARQVGVTSDGRPMYEDLTTILQNKGQGPAQTAAGPVTGAAQAAPKTITNPDGTTAFQTAAGAKIGAPPVATGGVNPAMLGTARSGSTSLDANGNTVTTSQSHKVAPPPAGSATGSARPAANTNGGSSAGGNGGNDLQRVPVFNPSNRIDNIVRLMGQDQASGEKLIASRQDKIAVGNRLAQLGIDPNNVTGSMRERAGNARLVLQHLNEVQNVIDEAASKGELGVVASRWNDFLTGKLGDDPTPDHIFSKLATNLTFLQSAVAMAHGGLRGGGSPQMVEHWEKALAAKDPETLKQQLNVAKSWMQGYASLVPKGNNQQQNQQQDQQPVTAPPPGAKKSLDQIFK